MCPSILGSNRSFLNRQNSGSYAVKDVDVGLFSALIGGEGRNVQRWLDRGANLHAVNKRGETALMRCSNVETLAWLIREGVAIDARDLEGCTALFVAAERGNAPKVRVLLEHGADVNARSHRGGTALLNAATWHKPQAVRLLLDHGAEVDVRSLGGYTPLMGAAWPYPTDTEAVETLTLLLNHGADVNAVDQEGKTALIHLLEDEQHDVGYAEIVRLLLFHHAKTEMVDSDGNTALSYSVRRGLNDVVALLTLQVESEGRMVEVGEF